MKNQKLDWFDYWKIVETNKRRSKHIRYIANDVKRELRENGRQLIFLMLVCIVVMLTIIVVGRI